MSEPNAPAPFYFEPSRQSPIAILVILAKLIRALIGQFWFVLVLLLLGRRPGSNNQFLLWMMLAGAVFSIGRSLVIYFRTHFYIQDGEFILEKGGFTRSRLSVALDKIQTITFQQTFVHRIFNVVSVEMDTSGSKGSEISINALDRKKADELREYLLAWKKENAAPESGDASIPLEKAPETTLLRLNFGDLLRIGLSQNHLRSGGILLGLAFSFSENLEPILGKSTFDYLTEELGLSLNVFWSFALWIALFFLIVSVFATLILTAVRFYGLRFVRTGDGFRLEAGLLTRREQAAYLPKIQYLRWTANPLQRLLGLFNLRLYQAAGHELSTKQTLQVPGCYQPQVDAVREAYFPGAGELTWSWYRPHRLYFDQRLFFIGLLPLIGLVVKTAIDFSWPWLAICLLWPPVTAWWQWQLFRRKRYGLSPEGLWNHSGFFNSVQTLLLWRNVQAVSVERSLIEARHQLVDLTFYTASGSVHIENIAQETGYKLRDYVLAKVEGWGDNGQSPSNRTREAELRLSSVTEPSREQMDDGSWTEPSR